MNGIDVSSNNGIIDWDAVKASTPALDFVYIKATEGVGYIDKKLSYNSKEAKRTDLKIGYYHFSTLNNFNTEIDAISEANYFISSIKEMPKSDLPLILDIETNKVGLSKEQVFSWIKSFFKQLETLGYKDYALYSYTPFLDGNLPTNHNLGTIKLWLAAYVSLEAPKLPHGWSNYWIWQYSSSGKINGIKNNVDLNKTK